MKRITILGGGMVGSAMAFDLYRDFQVTVADMNEDVLRLLEEKYEIKTIKTDLSSSRSVQDAIADADLVIGAVPGFMGYQTMKTVIESGKNMVDIAFFGEDPFELDALAKKHQVTAIVDCGVAPGMSNLILGYHHQHMNVESFECYVGGLPIKRVWPYEYKAPFSPIDVLEEYTRPARLVENSEIVTRPALSEPELMDFDPVGTLEAFNTDGLRTLIRTLPIPNMKEKTLRYPGHIERMRVLRESGFLSQDPVNIDGKSIRPLDLTTKLLFPMWKLGETEKEFTLMRIIIQGMEKGIHKQYTYDLYDEFDDKTGFSSMTRTTGYPCTAVARLVLDGEFTRQGVCPPEFIGARPEAYHRVMDDLKSRGIHYRMQEIPG